MIGKAHHLQSYFPSAHVTQWESAGARAGSQMPAQQLETQRESKEGEEMEAITEGQDGRKLKKPRRTVQTLDRLI